METIMITIEETGVAPTGGTIISAKIGILEGGSTELEKSIADEALPLIQGVLISLIGEPYENPDVVINKLFGIENE